MIRAALVGLVLVTTSAVAQPKRVYILVHPQWMNAGPEIATIKSALARGLFADSQLAVSSQASRQVPSTVLRDSSPTSVRRHLGIAAVHAEVSFAGKDTLQVVTSVFDVLCRRVAGPETVRVLPSTIDSVMTNVGMKYAKILDTLTVQRRPR